MSNQNDVKNSPQTTSLTKEKKWDKGSMPKRRKVRRDRDCPKTYPYRSHEYHPLKTTLKEVFMQTEDKERGSCRKHRG